jgi:hypothetical protein
MTQRACWAVGLCVSSLLVIGCQSPDAAEADDGDVAEARQAQVPTNPDRPWTLFQFTIDENPLFDLLVIGDEDVGSYNDRTEYWFVHTSRLVDLGEEDIEVTSSSPGGTPPSLSGDQEFTQPVYLTWENFTTDPVNVGELYSNSGGTHHLRVKVESGEVTRVVWYQIINHQSPANVAPSGTYSPGGSSVSVPSGYYGYAVDATIP